ncbi:uncharacterized protein LOC143883432 [Tasmannia lanceolata]|uniref:uncharacterized protein LOC143883432 n=1 Tax=Tasmannia lanceolata TaxID=3420 RepID=UPI0040638FC2
MLTQTRYLKGRFIPAVRSLFTSCPLFQLTNTQSHISFPQNSVYMMNTSITNCFQRGDVEAARRLFDEMTQRNLVTWNCMISGYIKNCRLSEAQRMFDIMPRRNIISWTVLLTGYTRNGMLREAQELFDKIPEKNIVCWNSMITGYINNGRIGNARELFDNMPIRNLVSWAIMIGGYLQHELVVEARNLFDQAPEKASYLYNVLLSGYVALGCLDDASRLFDKMPQRDVVSWTIMITCYSQARQMEIARRLFDEMPERCIEAWTAIIRGYLQTGEIKVASTLFDEMPSRDTIAWNSMISGYIHNGMMGDALQLFKQMPRRDIWSWNSILQGYVQQDDMVNASDLFEKMPKRNETSWNTIISGYRSEDAFVLLSRMLQEGFKPDQGTFTILISICAALASLGWGRTMHLLAVRSGYDYDTRVISALITMYSKCGLINDAVQVFKSMLKRDTIAWNAMIVAQAFHGSSLEARELFPAMIQAGFEPDHVTFLGLLSACAHKGLVDKGWDFFYSMERDWKLIPKPEHYTCMVDLLARSGLLSEAYDFIKKIPVDLPMNTWETLLSACRIHGNLELGEIVAKKVLDFQPSNGGVYVLLSNIYAAKGMWEDAASIRALMKERGAKKEQGCSWIEIKGKINVFVYNDRSHPQMGTIYKDLETLSIIIEEVSLPFCSS